MDWTAKWIWHRFFLVKIYCVQHLRSLKNSYSLRMSFFTHIDFKFCNIQVYRIIVGVAQRTRFPLNYGRISCQSVSLLPPSNSFVFPVKQSIFSITITQWSPRKLTPRHFSRSPSGALPARPVGPVVTLGCTRLSPLCLRHSNPLRLWLSWPWHSSLGSTGQSFCRLSLLWGSSDVSSWLDPCRASLAGRRQKSQCISFAKISFTFYFLFP